MSEYVDRHGHDLEGGLYSDTSTGQLFLLRETPTTVGFWPSKNLFTGKEERVTPKLAASLMRISNHEASKLVYEATSGAMKGIAETASHEFIPKYSSEEFFAQFHKGRLPKQREEAQS